MSSNPAEGVVDPRCRVHGVENLYIAGCSVFPTGGYINPTFPILTLALRIAEDVHGSLSRTASALVA
jgi:choline dehydrogenase-like flavoprotein